MSTSNDENDDDNDTAFWNAAATFRNYFELFEENNVLKLIGVLDNDNNEGNKPKRQRRTKSMYNRADQKRSLFYTEYLEPYDEKDEDEDIPLLDPASREGKKFRNLFRVPYSMFLDIVAEFERDDGRVHADCSGRKGIDRRLLILGSLRYVGITITFSALEELTRVSEMSHRIFFHEKFLLWGVRLARENIFLPRTDAEYDAVEGVYRSKGLPGCVGSIDCVHVRWDNCPAGLLGECVGKEGKPTLAFEVVVAHDRRVQSVSGYCHGAQNDKTISKHDRAVTTLRTPGSTLSEKTFELETNDIGDTEEHKGAYFICDGGYSTWTCLMPPYKEYEPTTIKEGWSKHVEGLRKDVECTFGILKKRFQVLKNPIRLSQAKEIQKMFVTCCALNNRLLAHDKRNNTGDELDHDNNADENVLHNPFEPHANNVQTSSKAEFQARRDALVNHYSICVNNRSLQLN